MRKLALILLIISASLNSYSQAKYRFGVTYGRVSRNDNPGPGSGYGLPYYSFQSGFNMNIRFERTSKISERSFLQLALAPGYRTYKTDLKCKSYCDDHETWDLANKTDSYSYLGIGAYFRKFLWSSPKSKSYLIIGPESATGLISRSKREYFKDGQHVGYSISSKDLTGGGGFYIKLGYSYTRTPENGHSYFIEPNIEIGSADEDMNYNFTIGMNLF